MCIRDRLVGVFHFLTPFRNRKAGVLFLPFAGVIMETENWQPQKRKYFERLHHWQKAIKNTKKPTEKIQSGINDLLTIV